MRIIITNTQKKIKLNKKKIKLIAFKTLQALAQPEETQVALSFVTRYRIKKANSKYFCKDRVTDVIALSYDDSMASNIHEGYLGDILICPSVANINARLYGNTFFTELSLYIIHGILHLLGYDDTSSKAEIKMRKKEQEILKRICG
ncbi:MAG: rRNA maturation RNase YbeY [Candidatus Orphnella occulta]|nr:rRNA maturation RNase YbeY [Candidatus Orphnella occulta]MDP8297175.1 rRNA maturation RNase YbeY [Candidatus Orphnella occulta]